MGESWFATAEGVLTEAAGDLDDGGLYGGREPFQLGPSAPLEAVRMV